MGVSIGDICTIADSQKNKYTQSLSFQWSSISRKPHLGGGEPANSSAQQRFLNNSSARTQLSAAPARETDAAVGRQFASVRYFVPVDGQPGLARERPERVRRRGE